MVAIGWPNNQINILKIYNKYESYGGLDKMNINSLAMGHRTTAEVDDCILYMYPSLKLCIFLLKFTIKRLLFTIYDPKLTEVVTNLLFFLHILESNYCSFISICTYS
jgi:hypothetical protein